MFVCMGSVSVCRGCSMLRRRKCIGGVEKNCWGNEVCVCKRGEIVFVWSGVCVCLCVGAEVCCVKKKVYGGVGNCTGEERV